jgi:O-antigen ligase
VLTVGALSEAAGETERLMRSVRFFVGAFLAISIAVGLNLPDEAVAPVRLSRWGILACASAFVLRYLLRSPLSRQGTAWLVSGLYAAGTTVYSIEVPATVLRSTAFVALTIGAFAGGLICYREETTAPHRLPDRMGTVLALLAVPSSIGLLFSSSEYFFQAGGWFRGVFVHANTLGAFGAMWLVVGVGIYDSRLSRGRRVVLIGIVALSICMIASQSRAGLGSAIVAIALYLLVTRKMRRLFVAGLLAATLLLSMVVWLPYASEVATRETGSFIFKGYEEDVFTSRRGTWETGWANFFASPWFGHGFGTSVGEETNEWKIVNLGGREKGNAFLAILEETGLVGALVMCFPLGLSVANGVRLKRLNVRLSGTSGHFSGDARLAAAFWAAAMGGIVNNYAEATLWSPGTPFGGMLLFLAGAAEGLMIRTERRG